MTTATEALAKRLQDCFGGILISCKTEFGEVTIHVSKEHTFEVCKALRDNNDFMFEQLIDLCGVDYETYGEEPWEAPRFAVVYHLLSVKRNQRVRLKVFLDETPRPRVDSVTEIWNSANWYEREAFDLYGILFEGHPDLRRLLTDYGFIGHPFRKDFPISGNVEMRYDPEKKRVVYEPVDIEPRTLVPKVFRHDNRYENKEQQGGA